MRGTLQGRNTNPRPLKKKKKKKKKGRGKREGENGERRMRIGRKGEVEGGR